MAHENRMALLHYLDFDLKFIRKDADSFLLACRSPAGEAAGAFRLPFAPLETENLILKLSRLKRACRTADSPELAAARKLGGGLFEAVFQGQVRDCFRASLEKVRVQPECGLRLKLRLQDTPELADLPWKYLYDQTFGRFLAQSVQTPLVRYLELPEGIRPLHTAFPLRILGLISSPSDYAALDTAREKELVEQAVAPLISQGLATLEWLPKADLSSLRAALRREHHILHFIGHSGVGELVLEDERGKGRLVSGEVLGVLLHDCRSLRLVVLNSCEGARSGPEDPFAGIAAALVRQGLPAVVAMQFEISDGVAIEFAKEFYDALALGWPVDAAVAEARKAVLCLGSMEWGTPVLHLRAANGVLFVLTGTEQEEKTGRYSAEDVSPAEKALTPIDPIRLEIESVSVQPVILPPLNPSLVHTLCGHDKKVNSIAFAPDGSLLVSGAGGDFVMGKIPLIQWDIISGKQVGVLTGHTDSVNSVALSPDGSLLASGERSKVHLRVAALGGALLHTWKTSLLTSVAFSPNSSLLAFNIDNKIQLWNIGEKKLLYTLEGHAGWFFPKVNSIAFSQDGSLLASCADDRTIRLWNVRTGELLDTLECADSSSKCNFLAVSQE